jgi:hypothetical protein
MAHMLWTAARRLFALVLIAAASVAIPFVAGARMGPLPAASGLLTLALLTTSLLPMLRARRLLRRLDTPAAQPPASMAYRASARTIENEATADGASRSAAIAIMLLSLAVASTIVAAASR